MGHSWTLFFSFCFSMQSTIGLQMFHIKITGFELQISGLGSDRSTVSATTTAQYFVIVSCLGSTASLWNEFHALLSMQRCCFYLNARQFFASKIILKQPSFLQSVNAVRAALLIQTTAAIKCRKLLKLSK